MSFFAQSSLEGIIYILQKKKQRPGEGCWLVQGLPACQPLCPHCALSLGCTTPMPGRWMQKEDSVKASHVSARKHRCRLPKPFCYGQNSCALPPIPLLKPKIQVNGAIERSRVMRMDLCVWSGDLVRRHERNGLFPGGQSSSLEHSILSICVTLWS